MESLHYGKILGEDRTNIGLCWEIATGIYYANFGVRGSRCAGCGTMFCRVVVPQRVTLPSLKFEQAVICPDGPSPATGEGDGEGADAPAATLGAYLCAVRTMLLHRSYPALQATERGSSRGNLSPLTRFCLLLAVQKEAPAGQAYSLCLCKRLRDAEGDHKLAPAG